MDVILIPGFWLNAASWDGVVPALQAEGHRSRALTLPGLAPIDDHRAGVRFADHVADVVDVIDDTDAPVLRDARRYDVPITVITCEFPSARRRLPGPPPTHDLAFVRTATMEQDDERRRWIIGPAPSDHRRRPRAAGAHNDSAVTVPAVRTPDQRAISASRSRASIGAAFS